MARSARKQLALQFNESPHRAKYLRGSPCMSKGMPNTFVGSYATFQPMSNNQRKISRAEQIEGAMWGLLVGDALGVPYEFHPPDQIPRLQDIEMKPPVNFVRAHRGVPPGTWSDDGALALCLLSSLLEQNRFDPVDFSRRLCDWYTHGTMAVDNRVFDVGVQTAKALHAITAGCDPLFAGGTEETSNGNGSLMRVLPLALWHQGTDEELVRDAFLQSAVTHRHLRSKVCCAIYCLWVRRTLSYAMDAWAAAISTFRSMYEPYAPELEELEWNLRPDDAATGKGTGYVVDTLRSARWALQQGTYEQVVKAAITLGHDTDTTACVAGGIAGCRDGINAIPDKWMMCMRGQEVAKPLIEQLVKRSS